MFDEIKKDKIIILAGPTAVGKSKVSVELAKKFNGEIVGADSMQIYKSMDIGTGKITEEERKGIRHHLIDILMPNQEYSVGQYVMDATAVITDILKRNKLPIITGGTGLYITSLILNRTFAGSQKNDEIRNRLNQIVERKGNQFVYNILTRIDPVSAMTLSQNDIKRVVRALEIFLTTGKRKSEMADSLTDENSRYDYLCLVLDKNRTELYNDIERRIDLMLKEGLVEEVERLKADLCANDKTQSLQAIGYKEVLEYIDGGVSYDEMVYKLKLNTRHYAKRQLTYFKNMPIHKVFVGANDLQKINDEVMKFISK